MHWNNTFSSAESNAANSIKICLSVVKIALAWLVDLHIVKNLKLTEGWKGLLRLVFVVYISSFIQIWLSVMKITCDCLVNCFLAYGELQKLNRSIETTHTQVFKVCESNDQFDLLIELIVAKIGLFWLVEKS